MKQNVVLCAILSALAIGQAILSSDLIVVINTNCYSDMSLLNAIVVFPETQSETFPDA